MCVCVCGEEGAGEGGRAGVSAGWDAPEKVDEDKGAIQRRRLDSRACFQSAPSGLCSWGSEDSSKPQARGCPPLFTAGAAAAAAAAAATVAAAETAVAAAGAAETAAVAAAVEAAAVSWRGGRERLLWGIVSTRDRTRRP